MRGRCQHENIPWLSCDRQIIFQEGRIRSSLNRIVNLRDRIGGGYWITTRNYGLDSINGRSDLPIGILDRAD